MSTNKKLKVLYDLAKFIEDQHENIDSNHFKKLKKYHHFLRFDEELVIQKVNKEFQKIKSLDYQFQVYLMNLERLLGQSLKEYDFLVKTNDSYNENAHSSNIVCLLDSIRSAHNIGAFFRNAECFGIQEIIMTGLSPTPESIQVKKTAMGCDQLVPWRYYKNTLEIVKEFKNKDYQVIAIETGANAISLNRFKPEDDKILLLFGHEQFGLSLELIKESHQIVRIPLRGQKNSLNVAISQGIVLNHLNVFFTNA